MLITTIVVVYVCDIVASSLTTQWWNFCNADYDDFYDYLVFCCVIVYDAMVELLPCWLRRLSCIFGCIFYSLAYLPLGKDKSICGGGRRPAFYFVFSE